MPGSVVALGSALASCSARSSADDNGEQVQSQLLDLKCAVLAAISEHKNSGGPIVLASHVNEETVLSDCAGTPDTSYLAAVCIIKLESSCGVSILAAGNVPRTRATSPCFANQAPHICHSNIPATGANVFWGKGTFICSADSPSL